MACAVCGEPPWTSSLLVAWKWCRLEPAPVSKRSWVAWKSPERHPSRSKRWTGTLAKAGRASRENHCGHQRFGTRGGSQSLRCSKRRWWRRRFLLSVNSFGCWRATIREASRRSPPSCENWPKARSGATRLASRAIVAFRPRNWSASC